MGFLIKCEVHTHICSVHSQHGEGYKRGRDLIFHRQKSISYPNCCSPGRDVIVMNSKKDQSWPRSPTLQSAYYGIVHFKHYHWLICVFSTETANKPSKTSLQSVGCTFAFMKTNKSSDFISAASFMQCTKSDMLKNTTVPLVTDT